MPVSFQTSVLTGPRFPRASLTQDTDHSPQNPGSTRFPGPPDLDDDGWPTSDKFEANQAWTQSSFCSNSAHYQWALPHSAEYTPARRVVAIQGPAYTAGMFKVMGVELSRVASRSCTAFCPTLRRSNKLPRRCCERSVFHVPSWLIHSRLTSLTSVG